MKKIIYFVGAYGCGKTTSTLKYANQIPNSTYILEDKTMIEMMKRIKMKNAPLIDTFIIMTYYYRIIKKIFSENDALFVDGHPLLSMIYLRANFELLNGLDVNMRDLFDFARIRFQMNKLTQDLFEGIDQEIIYINLPFDVHFDQVYERLIDDEDRYENFPMEDDIDWFTAIRRILHSEIFDLGSKLYNCKVTEVNSLEEIDKILGVANK